MNELIKFEDVKGIANSFIKSNLFYDTKSVEVAIVKIMAGHELGLQPFQSMQSFDIIQGKVFVKPILLSGLLKKGGKYDYRIIESTDKICIIGFYENKELIGESVVTIEECHRMGLTNKDNWKKQPNTMLFNRCMSQGIRRFAPDLYLMPIYTEGDEWFDNSPKEVKTIDNNKRKITKQEQKNLFDSCEKFKYKMTDLKEHIENKYNILKSMDLNYEQYLECLAHIEESIDLTAEYEEEIINDVEMFEQPKEVYYGQD
jgi:hypothetical protein